MKLISIFLLLLPLAYTQNIILPQTYNFSLSDMACVKGNNSQYVVWPQMNTYQPSNFAIEPSFSSSVQAAWSGYCNGSNTINFVAQLDLTYTANIIATITTITNTISSLNYTANGCRYPFNIQLNFIVNSSYQTWSSNTTLNYAFWRIVIPALEFAGLKTNIIISQQSWNQIFGSQNNPGFNNLFCQDYTTNACQSHSCGFGEFEFYFQDYLGSLEVCNITFVGVATLKQCGFGFLDK